MTLVVLFEGHGEGGTKEHTRTCGSQVRRIIFCCRQTTAENTDSQKKHVVRYPSVKLGEIIFQMFPKFIASYDE